MKIEPLIDLKAIVSANRRFRFLKPLIPLVNRILRIDQINATYSGYVQELEEGTITETNFFVGVLRHMKVTYEVSQEDLDKIPKTGPLMVVANHPYGGIDGLILGAVLSEVRPDVRLLANELLMKMDKIVPFMFGVNVFGGREAARRNIAAMKQARKWLESDGCVATFPGGTVSHFTFKTMMVVDPAWSDHLTNMAERTGAQVLPLYFPGRNSLWFQLTGLIHPIFRTMLIGRELMRVKGKTLSVRIGKPLPAKKLATFEKVEEKTQYLRLKSYILRDREMPDQPHKIVRFPRALSKRRVVHEPVIPEVEKELLIREIESLEPEALLFKQGPFQIYLVDAPSIPNTLEEIGRLREITFRAIGEGTGKSIDLDDFDSYYKHLFIWNNETCEVVGSYRLGLTDEILNDHGKKGLYITTLFKLKDEFFELLNPALELGRSFVRIEYQRKQATLALLWKGIGTFIGRHPRYTRLIGPVSITAEYSSISKDLMVQFLKERRSHPILSKLVKARKPHRLNKLRALLNESMKDAARTVDDVSALISEVEADQKGIPILLKHYLRLNGVMLSFNRDPKFSDVVDGLILVDLEQTDPAILRKHIGEEAWENFSAYYEKIRNRESS